MRWIVSTAALALLGLCGPAIAAPTDDVVAHTQDGDVAGRRLDDLTVYKAIPFARPPVGPLRWRAPQPVEHWQGLREARDFAPACMQVPTPGMNLPGQPVSEDCLYLNVWSPRHSAGERRPVLVWIHGGAFTAGSTAMPLFDGAALARKGVVFVGVTYRLGPLGFMAHPELSLEAPSHASGNYGLMDQIAALRWVRRNIAAFGGDPAQVTIMGESAGSISVAMLAQSPLAQGLFQRVIAQSGGAFYPSARGSLTLAKGEQEGIAYGAAIGAPTLAQLRAMPAEALMSATPRGPMAFSLMSSWPVLDGFVLPAAARQLYRTRRFNDTPVLMGNNDNEGGLFPTARTADAFQQEVRANYGPAAPRVLAAYPAGDDAQAAASATALMGDATFGVQHYAWSRAQATYGKGRVFYYHFAHQPPVLPGIPAGPIHGAELPYVFANLGVRAIGWSGDDRALSETMSTYWTNFAKKGDPNGPGLAPWPAFSVAAPKVMYFGEGAPSPGPVPHLDRVRLLDTIAREQDAKP